MSSPVSTEAAMSMVWRFQAEPLYSAYFREDSEGPVYAMQGCPLLSRARDVESPEYPLSRVEMCHAVPLYSAYFRTPPN